MMSVSSVLAAMFSSTNCLLSGIMLTLTCRENTDTGCLIKVNVLYLPDVSCATDDTKAALLTSAHTFLMLLSFRPTSRFPLTYSHTTGRSTLPSPSSCLSCVWPHYCTRLLGSVFNSLLLFSVRPNSKASHDYERLKSQCMRAMADLQSLQNQHTKTLKRCEEAVKEADFYQ